MFALAWLAACAAPEFDGEPVWELRSIYYGPHLVQYAGRSGRIPVVVHGAPFDDAGAVAAALRVPSWAGSRGFVLADATSAASTMRLVVVFAPAIERPRGHQVCAARETIPMQPTSGTLSVLGAFCDRNEALSQAFVAGTRPSTLADPGFRALLDRLTERVLVLKHPGRPRGTS